jgi:hypothetical protein
MNYNNDKLNEIYRDTWPNLGWATRMNEHNLPVPDDMCWVNLTKEEVEELRSKKHTLTEYGKEQLRKLMTHEEMLEEAARREAGDDDDFGQLGYLKRMEREEAAKREKEDEFIEEVLDALDKVEEDLTAKKQVPREEVMRIAIAAIDKHSDELKQLAAIERKELIEELEALKKENFQKVADYCMEQYTKQYGEMPEDEYWVYMVADYFGTGEGTTTCLMVTQATPYGHDYPSEGPDKYKPVNSQVYRAVRKFHEQFGTWMLHGLKFLPKNEFYTQCAYFIPPAMMKLANAKCFKEFYNEVHYNFS